MSQGTAKIDIFRSDDDRREFLVLVGQLRRRFGVEVHAYVLMGSHYHLLVRSVDGRLSDAMQWLGTRYARGFNGRHERVGAFFRSRFTSRLVEDDAYLAWLPTYIHLNPVKDRFVERPEQWRWSSYAAIAGLRAKPSWLATGVVGAGLSRAGFVAATEAHMAAPGPYRRREPEAIWLSWSLDAALDPPVPLDSIDGAVVSVFGLDAPETLRQRTAAGAARTIAVALAADLSDHSRVEIAEHYGLASASSVGSAVGRAKPALSTDPRVAQIIQLLAA